MKIAVIFNLSHKGVINVFGRQNRERYSEEEIGAVGEALRARKNTVETFEGDKTLIEKLEAFMPRVLKSEKPGLVFNLAYGIQGESRYTHIPSLLEMLGIPYLGSGPLAHSIALDKAMTKIVLSRAGLPTPRFQVVNSAAWTLEEGLRFPLIVKPKDEAVSFGVQVVQDEPALREAVQGTLQEFNQPALVEEFLPGKELNIGLLGNGEQLELLPIVEIDFGEATERFQTFDSKKQHRFTHHCPAQIPDELARQVHDIAQQAFAVTGCRDCARIDFRLDEEGRPHILEINSMPAVHRMGSYFAAAQEVGYDYEGMINRMVEVAVARYFGGPPPGARSARRATPKDQPEEVRVTEYIRSSSGRMEQHLAELVDCNSYTRNKEGTDRVGQMMLRALEPLGFVCQVFPQTEIGNVLLLQNRFEGDQADVLLLCHTDVFAPPDHNGHRRFTRSGTRMYGAGIAESKGGLVVIESVLRALRHLRVLSQLRIKVLLTTDHALGNRYSAPIVQREASLSRCVLSFKPGGDEGEVVTRRNGVGIFSALVECRVPVVTTDFLHRGGANAISELACKVRAWNRLSDPERNVVVCVTSLQAEARSANLPESGHATLFLSFPQVEMGEQLVAEIKKIARRQQVGEATCTLQGGIEHAPFLETEAVMGLYEELTGIADSLGMTLGRSMRYTGSEINLVRPDARAVDGLGPLGHLTRTAEEHIEANTLVERAVLLTLFLRRMANHAR